MGIILWQRKGPWAGRALAAHQYWNWFGALSLSLDWAARSLEIQAPSPLLYVHVREKESETMPQEDAPSEPTTALLDRPPRRPRDGPHSRAPRKQEPVASKPSPPQPVTPTVSRDLSASEVMDTSPPRRQVTPWRGDGAPSRLEPRAWDGRHLDTPSRSNSPRGGYGYPPERMLRGKSENSAGPRKGNMCGKSKSAPTSPPNGEIKSE